AEEMRRADRRLLLGDRPASHVFDFLGGLVFQLAGLVQSFVTHIARLLFGAHVNRLFGGLESWCRLEKILGERYRNNALACSVGRERERAKWYGDALLPHAEETAQADHRGGNAPSFVKQHIVDI